MMHSLLEEHNRDTVVVAFSCKKRKEEESDRQAGRDAKGLKGEDGN